MVVLTTAGIAVGIAGKVIGTTAKVSYIIGKNIINSGVYVGKKAYKMTRKNRRNNSQNKNTQNKNTKNKNTKNKKTKNKKTQK